MELANFASTVPGFDRMGDREKVRYFAWYLHSYRNLEMFATGDVRKCFERPFTSAA